MRRRDFISGLGSATAWPAVARAQPTESMRRVGVLMPIAENAPEVTLRAAALERGLAALGWTVGRNIQIDYRWAFADPERIRAYVVELVHLPSEVIVAVSSAVVAALQKETRSVPVVFVQVAEPVAQGFVASLAHPGGNITGFTNIVPSLGGKWVAMLKEIAPHITRVAVMYNPETGPYSPLFLSSVEMAAPSLAIAPISMPVANVAEVEQSIDAFIRDGGGGLLVLPDPFTSFHRKSIIATAAKYRLPAINLYPEFVTGGGLMSYGDDAVAHYRQAASYIHRILLGEKPADLPVQGPAKFRLVINLKTARAFGLTVPRTLLAFADEVIQ